MTETIKKDVKREDVVRQRVSRLSLSRGPLFIPKQYLNPSKQYYFPDDNELPYCLHVGYTFTDPQKPENKALAEYCSYAPIAEGTAIQNTRITKTLAGTGIKHYLVEKPLTEYIEDMNELDQLNQELEIAKGALSKSHNDRGIQVDKVENKSELLEQMKQN